MAGHFIPATVQFMFHGLIMPFLKLGEEGKAQPGQDSMDNSHG